MAEATTGNKRGPRKKYGPREEIHLKFSPRQLEFIQANAPDGYQAFFDALITQQMKLAEQAMIMGMDLDLHIRDLQKTVDYPPESYEVVRNLRMHADATVQYALEHLLPVLPKYLQTRISQVLTMRSQIWNKEPS